MEQAVHALLEERPWYYQDEIQAFLLDAFDVDISVRSVSNLLSRLKITRKKLRVEAAQRSAELRTDWKYHLQFFTAIRLSASTSPEVTREMVIVHMDGQSVELRLLYAVGFKVSLECPY